MAAAKTATPDEVAELLGRLLGAAAGTPAVQEALKDVAAGEALVRFTDAPITFHFKAGAGALSAARTTIRAGVPKVDATSATWIGLIGGTLRPWLAFTRGLVVCRAGLTELRWLQQVAERLQRGYADARAAGQNDADG